jgi:molybdenum cofactor cytidylyltransferase
MTITGILLAAGYSRRFGSDKLLHPLADQTPMALVAARHLRAAVDELLIVIRPESKILIDLLQREQFSVVTCEEAATGMGASLACGIKASANAQAWLIALADMPFIQVQTIEKLANLLRQGAAIVAPQYQGRRGHPVGFHGRFYQPLSQLHGEQGARLLLQRYHNQLTLFTCEDQGTVWDIDVSNC